MTNLPGANLHLPEGCMAGIAMHELSLLENVREILEDHAQSQKFSKVSRVTLEIGKLSCIEPEALRFGFDVVMKGSLAEGAELIITELNGLGRCQQCGQNTVMEVLYDPCSHCGRPLTVVQGMEMKIKDLVVI
ncbi:MAG: hydrogenase maturation nickel metallochaperone HypA [Methylococcaceae bacterium]|nr:hydrogenase maturation nickel metallochaperone HypA [Methylococcaceae bacterium]MDZ4155132.1 hydrogenase maturation nickel metallochaperone HypA [Methylococcales bacterium]MDP2394424.1 hydrogenase maturation nickel metallochaperone HypA [Methylococcaceae bacterium]MDP3021467.1 hydrogenase maturation nickel metallochaperone HypA [Methylococcaceae bacterium]MDP3389980.1 hydrogenase maturation nickel metallochaperone HypA [Methylococcaceae bacterium]